MNYFPQLTLYHLNAGLHMAPLVAQFRRIRRKLGTKTIQIIVVFIIIFFVARFVIKNNYDPPPSSPVKSHVVEPPVFTHDVDDPSIDWSKNAYVQYVVSPEYLCNAMMLFSSLDELGSRAQRVLLYPSNWSINEVDPYDEGLRLMPIARLLQSAVMDWNVVLQPTDILTKDHVRQETWKSSYTKLLAWNLTQYERILTLDSDSIVLKSLDELFLLPAAPLAMPYVYWGEPTGWEISSQVMLLQPSTKEYAKIERAIEEATDDEYDMDIIQKLYSDTVVRIPQRPYNLLSGEFRRHDHSAYLGSPSASSSTKTEAEKWDAQAVIDEAKFVHFSDWPVPKPWIRASRALMAKYTPECISRGMFKSKDCSDREAWLRLYYDFAVRRKRVCGAGFELQSRELSPNAVLRHGRWYEIDEVDV